MDGSRSHRGCLLNPLKCVGPARRRVGGRHGEGSPEGEGGEPRAMTGVLPGGPCCGPALLVPWSLSRTGPTPPAPPWASISFLRDTQPFWKPGVSPCPSLAPSLATHPTRGQCPLSTFLFSCTSLEGWTHSVKDAVSHLDCEGGPGHWRCRWTPPSPAHPAAMSLDDPAATHGPTAHPLHTHTHTGSPAPGALWACGQGHRPLRELPHTTHLHGVGECHAAQAADVLDGCVEQGPDDVVGHRGLTLDVIMVVVPGAALWGFPSTATLFCLIISAFGGAGVVPREEGLRRGAPDAEA